MPANTNKILIEIFGQNRLSGPIQQAAQSLVRLEQVANNAGAAIGRIGGKLTGTLAAFAGGLGVQELGQSLTSAAANLQDYRSRLAAIAPNAADVAREQQYVAETAQRMGIDLATARDGYTRFLSLMRSGILNQQQARQMFIGLANAQQAMGASSGQMGNVLYGLAQALSSATLTAEDMNQVVEPLPGLLFRLDRAAGLPEGGFKRLAAAGQVTAQQFRTVLLAALRDFPVGVEKTINNINPTLVRLKNTWTLFLEDFEKPVGAVVVTSLKAAMAVIEALRRDIAQGISFAEMQAQLKLWGQAVTDVSGKTALSMLDLRGTVDWLGYYFQQVLKQFASGFLDMPTNIRASFAIIFGEATKLKANVAAALQSLSAYADHYASQFGLIFQLGLTRVGGFYDQFLDGLSKDMADALTKLAQGVEKIPFIGAEKARSIQDVADAMRASATRTEDTRGKVAALNAEYEQLPRILKANLAAIEQERVAKGATADQAVESALREREANLAVRDSTIARLEVQRKVNQEASKAGAENALAKQIEATRKSQKDAVDEYLKGSDAIAKKQMQIAKGVTAPIDADPQEAARKRIEDLQTKLNGLSRGAVVPITVIQSGAAPEFATGGWVHGPLGRDRIPAWLTSGEFVVREPIAKRHRKLLEALNGASLPATEGQYAQGGVVRPMDEVNINLSIGGKRMQVRGSRDTARALSDALTDLSRALPA